MRWPFCLGRFEKLCLCAASLVLSTRLAVHKQSFLNIFFFRVGNLIFWEFKRFFLQTFASFLNDE